MNYYQHHIGDFNSATMCLTRVERALYRDLIELYYDKEKPLISDLRLLKKLMRVVTKEEEEALNMVLELYFRLEEDGYHNDRCDAELEKYHSKSEAKVRAGKASAAKRNKRLTGVEQPLNKRSTNQEPITNNQDNPSCTISPKAANGYTPEFEAAWTDYPKREGGNPKKSAFCKWKARLKAGATVEELHQGVIRYANFIRAKGKEHTSYVKQAATFFGPDEHYNESWEISHETSENPSGHSSWQQSPAARRNDIHRRAYREIAEKAAIEGRMDSGDF
jgi:uncharacterized protein YdaU (DUF1376 family)